VDGEPFRRHYPNHNMFKSSGSRQVMATAIVLLPFTNLSGEESNNSRRHLVELDSCVLVACLHHRIDIGIELQIILHRLLHHGTEIAVVALR